LARSYLRQGSRLLEVERSAEARLAAEREAQAERAHEAANALAAIEGATSVLQRYQDRLDDGTRAELAEAVSDEVRRLQQLIRITDTATAGSPGRFRLTEALAAVATAARSQGSRITMDVPDHLVAIGEPAGVAQVLQN